MHNERTAKMITILLPLPELINTSNLGNLRNNTENSPLGFSLVPGIPCVVQVVLFQKEPEKGSFWSRLLFRGSQIAHANIDL